MSRENFPSYAPEGCVWVVNLLLSHAQLPRTLWSGQIHPHSPGFGTTYLGRLLMALLSCDHTATDDRFNFPASAAHDVL
jgi:hypothetical protein